MAITTEKDLLWKLSGRGNLESHSLGGMSYGDEEILISSLNYSRLVEQVTFA